MGASVQPDTPSSGSPPGAAGVTFDEMEAELKRQEEQVLRPDLGQIKLEGDDVPETLRGKSATEAISRVRELENALRLSETNRQQAMTMAQMASQRAPEAPKPVEPAPEPQITAEMVAEAFNEDPAKGIQLMSKMQEQGIARAAAQFSQRIDPLLAGTVSSAEAEARRKYADEFSIYGDEIKATLAQVPNKNVMSSPASWDDLIAYVRGKDPMKLFKHMQDKERQTQQNGAYEQQRQIAGMTMSGNRPPAPVSGGVVIDDTVKEVCKVMGISEADYAKWAKVSS